MPYDEFSKKEIVSKFLPQRSEITTPYFRRAVCREPKQKGERFPRKATSSWFPFAVVNYWIFVKITSVTSVILLKIRFSLAIIIGATTPEQKSNFLEDP